MVARRRTAAWRTRYPASAEIIDDGHGVKIVLPIVPPSANELKKQYGRFIARDIRRAVRNLLGELLLAATRGTPGLNPPTGRRRVQYVVYRGCALDEENIGAGTKPITDELVEIGLLKDDSPAWCDMRPVVQVAVAASDQWRTEIVIETLGK